MKKLFLISLKYIIGLLKIEKFIKGGATMQVMVNYYSRDNVGSKDFNNDFLESITKEIKKIATQHHSMTDALEQIEKYLKECEFETGQGYEINYDEKTITLYDKKISHGASWGYDEVTVKLIEDDPLQSPLVQGLLQLKEKINDNDKYIATVHFDDNCSPLSPIYTNLKLYLQEIEHFEDDEDFDWRDVKEVYLTGKEVKELIIDNWIEQVLYIEEESPGYAWGEEVDIVPVNSSNPFARAGNYWEWDGDKNKFEITVYYTYSFCCHLYSASETITVARIDKSK